MNKMSELPMGSLQTYISAYEKWVVNNEQTIGDLETTAKWISYLIAGRISNSPTTTELVYTLSNLMVWYHDHIIYKSKCQKNSKDALQWRNFWMESNHEKSMLNMNTKCQRIKVILTTIEYSQVLFEICTRHYLGKRAEWYLITLLQVFKASLRLYIVNNSIERIVPSPAIMSLNRKILTRARKSKLTSGNCQKDFDDNDGDDDIVKNAYTKCYRLKRSGHIIRTIKGAPLSIQDRSFDLQNEFGQNYDYIPHQMTMDEYKRTSQKLLYGEYLYIAKPLIHLSAMGVFGKRGWSQYLISLLLDLMSIRIYQRNRHLMTKKQQTILSYRCMNLCTYLLRTPFYERCCQRRIDTVLNYLQDNIPFSRVIFNPIQEYLPHWQGTYFHMWST